MAQLLRNLEVLCHILNEVAVVYLHDYSCSSFISSRLKRIVQVVT